MTVAVPPEVEFRHPEKWEDLTDVTAQEARFVYVPYRRYLAIEGAETPGSPEFQAAIGTLYPVGYGLHFALKARGVNAPVGMLEGVYWFNQPAPMPLSVFASERDPANLPGPMHWRLLLAIPEEATDEEVQAAITEVSRHGSARADWLARLEVRGWLEGECAQILHVGPYDAEYPTEVRLHEAMAAAGLRPRGCHHEIYLSSPSAPPEKTRTILRQPVEEIAW